MRIKRACLAPLISSAGITATLIFAKIRVAVIPADEISGAKHALFILTWHTELAVIR